MKSLKITSVVLLAVVIMAAIGGAQPTNIITCFGEWCFNATNFNVVLDGNGDDDDDVANGPYIEWNGNPLTPERIGEPQNPRMCGDTPPAAFTSGPDFALINPAGGVVYRLCEGNDQANLVAELPGTFVSFIIGSVAPWTVGPAKVEGNEGDDVIFDSTFLPGMTLDGNDGNDQVTTVADAILRGQAGDDTLTGGGPSQGGSETELSGNDCLGGKGGTKYQDDDEATPPGFGYDCATVQEEWKNVPLDEEEQAGDIEEGNDIFVGGTGWDSLRADPRDGNDVVTFNVGDVPGAKTEVWECFDDDVVVMNGISTAGTVVTLDGSGPESAFILYTDPNTGGQYLIIAGGWKVNEEPDGDLVATQVNGGPEGTCVVVNY